MDTTYLDTGRGTVYYLAMTKTLNTKHVAQHTDENGTVWPETTLLRYTDENGEGGCWYESLERAETSWNRWIDSKPARERRRAAAVELRARSAKFSDDPCARFDA